MQDELKKIDKILQIDEDPKGALFDHIEEEEQKIAEISQKIEDTQIQSESRDEEIDKKKIF